MVRQSSEPLPARIWSAVTPNRLAAVVRSRVLTGSGYRRRVSSAIAPSVAITRGDGGNAPSLVFSLTRSLICSPGVYPGIARIAGRSSSTADGRLASSLVDIATID
jgi:hypothetical protein